MPTRIFVPLDRSELSERALAWAAAIARRSGAVLRLGHAWGPHPVPMGDAVASAWAYDERAREEAETYLTATATSVRATTGLTVEAALLELPVAEAILEDTATSHADLIVMSTHGRTGWSRFWIGSVADSVVRRAAVPVLLVRATAGAAASAPHPMRILVPLDGTAAGERILGPLEDVLLAGDLSITLLSVVRPVCTVDASPDGLARYVADQQATDDEVHRVQERLHEIAQRLRFEHPRLRVSIRVGVAEHAGPAVVSAAAEADVVAMATHGRGASRMLFGSVADKVLRGTGASLLLVHELDAADAKHADAGAEALVQATF